METNYPEVKVLALSTMDAETAIIKMIKSGAKGYVLKDADTEIIAQAAKMLGDARINIAANDLIPLLKITLKRWILKHIGTDLHG